MALKEFWCWLHETPNALILYVALLHSGIALALWHDPSIMYFPFINSLGQFSHKTVSGLFAMTSLLALGTARLSVSSRLYSRYSGDFLSLLCLLPQQALLLMSTTMIAITIYRGVGGNDASPYSRWYIFADHLNWFVTTAFHTYALWVKARILPWSWAGDTWK